MNVFQHPPPHRTLQLLSESDLPTDDLDGVALEHFLGCGSETNPDGVVGLEIHGSIALLRSLAVTPRSRAKGCGAVLVRSAEALAQANGIDCLYLLTETAEGFFAKLGYKCVERNAVPEGIRETKQFSELCPDSAVVMRKRLS